MLSIDTETTGLDLHHGAKPFLVTTCDEESNQIVYEWWVDPLTREPKIPRHDIKEIDELLADCGYMVFQNPKFDVRALVSIGCKWPKPYWNRVYDTLTAGHLLASNEPHDLTTMVLRYLGVDVSKYEETLRVACTKARSIAKRQFPNWRIAKRGLPEMPSAKTKVWKFDMWLLKVLAKKLRYAKDHPWFHDCLDYANVDSSSTLALFKKQQELLKSRELWKIYQHRLKLIRVVYSMENRGIHINLDTVDKEIARYALSSYKLGSKCRAIAKTYDYALALPKGSSNKSLHSFIYDVLKLEPFSRSKKTGKASLDRNTLDHFEAILSKTSKPYKFIKALKNKRACDTAINYLSGYTRFRIDVDTASGRWALLHPSLNISGTHTLRFSSQNPSEHNVSKQQGYNLRNVFGPLPGREWWSFDAKNLELRITAYTANEPGMIRLFEHPEEPPYFGSYHLLVFDILHPDLFSQYGIESKDKFGSTEYQWVKNGNFAVQYGAVETSGTADKAYHVKGAQRTIQNKFSNIAKLNQTKILEATEKGYVETLPDFTVDPDRGYPLVCPKVYYNGSRRGRVKPTIPLNYFTQGTAMQWMGAAMIRTQDYLDIINKPFVRRPDKQGFMIIQVHDELIFDFPRGVGKDSYKTNLPKARKIKELMEIGGIDIGLNIAVSCSYHTESWGISKSIAL